MEISAVDYEKFKNILEKQSGILLGNNKQYLVVSRLSTFIKEKNLESMSNLIGRISSPAGSVLLKEVVDRMTTNETLWFRDKYPFEYLKKTIIPEVRSKNFGNIRILSAACSSGQEPYSIAMDLDELNLLGSTEIVAADLSDTVINKAKQGIYQKIELNRGMPGDKLKKYFQPHEGEDWQVNIKLRNKIRFQTLNLLKQPYTMGKFDVVFCRNVLIYFSSDNKTKVINGLINSLKPGGYLFLGASEALTKESLPMKMIRCNPGLVYQKEN